MRLLRLVASGDYAIDLHPYVTVVTGLTEDQHAAVVAAFQAAVQGRTSELGGLLEVHDVLLDLDERTLALLDLDGVSVDIIVEAADLPGASSSDVGRRHGVAARRREAMQATVEERRQALERAEHLAGEAQAALAARRAELEAGDGDGAGADADGPDDAELAQLQAALASAEEAVQALAEPGSRASGELEQAERARDEAVAAEPPVDPEAQAERARVLGERRDELVAALDPAAVEDFERALAHVQQLEAAAHAADGADEQDAEQDGSDPDSDPGDPSDLADPAPPVDVDARMEEIRGALALHASFEATDVRTALDAFRLHPSSGQLVPSTEAVQLADRLGHLDRRIAALEERSDEEPDPEAMARVADRLERVRAEIRDAEQGIAVADIEANVAALEAAHAEVVEAREALEGRFAGGRAQQRYETALAAEEAILDALGIRSYTDFMTGGRASIYVNSEPEDLRRLRAEERELELELRDLERRDERAQELAVVEQDRRELRGQARTLLDDVEVEAHDLLRALYALRVPAEGTTPTDDLVDALEGVGLPVRDLDLDADDLEAMAAGWLEEYGRADAHRAALQAELARLEAARPSTSEPADDLPYAADEVPDADEVSDDAADDDEVTDRGPTEEAARDDDPARAKADAQAAVRAAQQRMMDHETAARALAELDAEVEVLEADERELALWQARIDDAEQAVAEARARVEELDAQRAAADAAVVEARSALEQHRADDGTRRDALAAAVRDAEAATADADQRLHAAREELDQAVAALDAATAETDGLQAQIAELAGAPAPVEEIEWYLLARLAGQRQVSFAGSLPMVVDDALTAVDDEGLVHLLDRLERMAGAVQVVHLTDDERVVTWARSVGDDRAAVVGPGPDDADGSSGS